MADDIELAPTEAATPKIKIIIVVAVGLVIALAGTAGGLYALGVFSGDASSAVEQTADGEPVPEVPMPALYVALEPAFTVNFTDKGAVRYLQLQIQAMTRDPDIEPEIKRHMPVIRNDLMLLFSAKSSKELSSREGKEELQAEALASIQGILEREAGRPGVEAVYFTSFVMQ